MGKKNKNRKPLENYEYEQQSESSANHIEQDGVVTNSVKGIIFVELSSGQTVQAYLGGKIRQNKINIVPGDRVLVKLSPYDMSKGIIFRRL